MKKYKIIEYIILAFMLSGCTKTVSLQESTDMEALVSAEVSEGDDNIICTDISYEEKQVPVYVCGAVNNPGVYYLSESSIKKDALEAAGGLADGAAIDYVNLAEPIEDNEKIYFPYEQEVETSYNLSEEAYVKEESGKVNINSANKEMLMTLPGIGESKADAIVEYREANGPFNDISDIMNIPGVKDGVYNKIKDLITV